MMSNNKHTRYLLFVASEKDYSKVNIENRPTKINEDYFKQPQHGRMYIACSEKAVMKDF